MTVRSAAFWAAAGGLFLLVVVRNVYVASMNPDDWRAVADEMVYPLIDSGRWLAHLISNYAGPSLVRATAFQLLVSFLLCIWTARALAHFATEVRDREFATLVIFSVGVTHVYFGDFINFNEFIIAYSMCLAGSVWAFTRVIMKSATWHSMLIAVQVVAFVVAVYPSFILLGAFVPIIVLMRADNYALEVALKAIVRGVVLTIFGVAVYFVEQEIATLLIDSETTVSRFHFADFETAVDNLKNLPKIVQWVHSTSLSLTGSRAFRLFFLLASAGIFGYCLLAVFLFTFRDDGAPRFIALARMLTGLVVTFFFLPTSFWMIYTDNDLPGRSLGFYGFILAATGLVFFTIHSRSGVKIPGMRWAVVALCSALVVVGAISSAKMADLLGIASARDSDLAARIAERIKRLPDFEGRIVNIIGGIEYGDLAWRIYRPTSSFGRGNEFNAALAPYLDLDRWVAHIPTGPRSCPAFPTSGSVYAVDGVAYVCLRVRDDGWNDSRCTLVEELEGLACFGNDFVAFFLQNCESSSSGTGIVQLRFRDRFGHSLLTGESLADGLGKTRIGKGCAFFAATAAPAFHDVVLKGLGMDSRKRWQVVLLSDQLEASINFDLSETVRQTGTN